jgi:hypothetical protein
VTGGGPPERWVPAASSPRAVEAAEEQAPVAGADAPATGRSVGGVMRVAEAPARAAEVSGSTVVAAAGAAAASAEPSRKRKCGFSTLM